VRSTLEKVHQKVDGTF